MVSPRNLRSATSAICTRSPSRSTEPSLATTRLSIARITSPGWSTPAQTPAEETVVTTTPRSSSASFSALRIAGLSVLKVPIERSM